MRRLLALIFNPNGARPVAVGGCPTYRNPEIPRGPDTRPLSLRMMGIGGPALPVSGLCPPGTVPRYRKRWDGTWGHTCVPVMEYTPPPLPMARRCPPGTVPRRKRRPSGGFVDLCVPKPPSVGPSQLPGVPTRPQPGQPASRGSGIARAVLMGARPLEIQQPEYVGGYTLKRGATL